MEETSLKKIILFQFVIISTLVIILVCNIYYSHTKPSTNNFPLLSLRVSSGILPASSLLIFNFKPLQKEIQAYISEKNLNVSVYVLNLRDGASMGILGGEELEPASLNKLPIAVEIMRKIEKDELSLDITDSDDLTLDKQIPIKEKYLDSKSGTLYKKNYTSLSVRELLYYMLSESDNTATYALLDQLNLEDLRDLSIYLDYYTKPIDAEHPENNTLKITPRSTSHLFVSLYLSTVLEPTDSQYLLSLLTNTSYDIKKYARLPPEVIVAQKYGSIHDGETDLFHSCGIMYIGDSRIFYCVMTRKLNKEDASIVVGDIVHKIYSYVVDVQKTLKEPTF